MSAQLPAVVASSPTAATSADADLNSVRLGNGEALVLIHGLGANLAFWFFGPAQLLADRYQVVMYDLRGHGRSPMPRSGYDLGSMAGDLLSLLDRLGVAQADLVGHSFGGRVALTFAALYPHRVRKLVIADTPLRALQGPVRLGDWPHWPRWKAELMSLGLEHPPSDDRVIDYRLLAELGRQGGGPGRKAALEGGSPAQRRIDLRSRQMSARGAQRWQQLLQQTTAPQDFEDENPLDREGLAAIAAPTLLMFGEYSHCLPTAHRLRELLQNARLMMIPGAGHYFPVVKPAYFERGLNRFLARPEAARVGGLRRMHPRRRPGVRPQERALV
jgi:pimeloyl-ACP methyl ester carboxylesterase